jgi:L,D-peptidoglycan transpeptidase YkuD (ErfK/YbiS/YcfS/YnhG family)
MVDRIYVDTAARCLIALDRSFSCAIGRSGAVPAADKREGDGMTPQGQYPLRWIYARPDRVAPFSATLPLKWLSPDDGWCDAPADDAYNRPVKRPYSASHERLWRDDGLYDLIVVLGHNDDPVVPGLGSAIFWHCAQEDLRATEGCVAIPKADLLSLLRHCHAGTQFVIS